MSTGANSEIDLYTRISNLEIAAFGGPNPLGGFPLVVGGFGNPPIVYTASVASLTFASGNFNVAVTMLPAAAPAGLYRATAYGVVTTLITGATSWAFKLGFTDDDQAQTPTVCTSSTLTAGTAESGSYTFRSTGATALTFTPTAASISAGVIAYSFVLERLQ